MNNIPRRFLFIAIVVFIATAVLLIFSGINRSRMTAKITIEVSPSGSTIKLNDKGIKEGTRKVRPGSYTIKVSHDGFTTGSKSITISKNQNVYVGIVLDPSSLSTNNWFDTHPEDALKGEGITGKSMDQASQELQAKFPIITNLPFIDQEYRIDYGKSKKEPDNPQALAIVITYYSESGKQQAIDWIRFKGYNPDNMEIIYINKPFSF